MKGKVRCMLLFVLVGCGLVAATAGTGSPALWTDEIQFEEGIVYGTGGEEELTLNVARPAEAEGVLPCVVVIHGGAWRAGDKAAHNDQIKEFARRGYVSATVGYRFCPKYPFPAQVEDVQCAVRFLRAHAKEYRIDPERIGAVGFSAGAHLSMMLGVLDDEDGLEGQGGWADQSSKVRAVVSFFGPTDLLAGDFGEASRGFLKDFIGGTPAEKADAHRRASPVTYVNEGDAAMLLFQGTKDPLVPHTQAYAMVEALTAAGVPGGVELLLGAGHGWGGSDRERTMRETFEFFDEQLKK
jgi:acetyl esterase/lipase